MPDDCCKTTLEGNAFCVLPGASAVNSCGCASAVHNDLRLINLAQLTLASEVVSLSQIGENHVEKDS